MPGVAPADGRDPVPRSESGHPLAHLQHDSCVGVAEGPWAAARPSAGVSPGEAPPPRQLRAGAHQGAFHLQQHAPGGRLGDILLHQPDPSVWHDRRNRQLASHMRVLRCNAPPLALATLRGSGDFPSPSPPAIRPASSERCWGLLGSAWASVWPCTPVEGVPHLPAEPPPPLF